MRLRSQFFIVFVICISFGALAQSKNNSSKVLSKQDSVRLDSLFERVLRSELFSSERQIYLDSMLLVKRDLAYVWQQKSMPLFKQKKYELGMKFLDSAVVFDRSYRWLEYRAFIKCIFQKSYKAAISDFKMAERKNPGGIVMDHTYDFYSGLCFLQLNEFNQAEKYIRKSITSGIKRVNEGHHLEYLYLGIILMEKKNYTEAIETFDKALKNYTHFSDAKFYKALCLEKVGKKDTAIVLLKEALSDLKAGYTINEDNVIYEDYPYQVKQRWITAKINSGKIME